MKNKIYILAVLSLAMASFLLVHFGLIWAYGRYYIYESNIVVLVLETTFIAAILTFSLFCIIEQLRRSNAGAGNQKIAANVPVVFRSKYPG